MTPTNRLRFVKREVPAPEYGPNIVKAIRILQQWWEGFRGRGEWRDIPLEEEPQTCTWQQDGDSDSGVYGTSCGHYFQIEDSTPADNKMAWCCYCGKKLAQELIAENEDE